MSYLTYRLNMLLHQIRFELMKLLRMPAYVITLIGLPLFFYMATGTNQKMPEFTEGLHSVEYLLCTLGTFGIFGIALFGFGVNYSIERSQGWYHTLQWAPVPLWAVFASKLIACLLLSSIAIFMLLLEANLVFGVTLPWISWMGIYLTLLFGTLPLCGLALLVGSLFGSNSVSLITIMLYLSVSSVSGLLATLSMIRKGNPGMAEMAVIYPTYHIYQLALANLQPITAAAMLYHISILFAYLFVCSAIVLLLFKKHLKRTHG